MLHSPIGHKLQSRNSAIQWEITLVTPNKQLLLPDQWEITLVIPHKQILLPDQWVISLDTGTSQTASVSSPIGNRKTQTASVTSPMGNHASHTTNSFCYLTNGKSR